MMRKKTIPATKDIVALVKAASEAKLLLSGKVDDIRLEVTTSKSTGQICFTVKSKKTGRRVVVLSGEYFYAFDGDVSFTGEITGVDGGAELTAWVAEWADLESAGSLSVTGRSAVTEKGG